MAYTKNIAIRHRLDMRIEYIFRDSKTLYTDPSTGAETYLRGSLNCIQQQAYQDMMSTKQRWNKDWGVAGYHIIQSFKADEVTPPVAFEIISRFAEQHLGKYEVAYSTHTDADNVHGHIVFNSVSFVDGTKYRGNFHDYYKGIRETSDALCREHGLSVIPYKDDAPGSRQYTERQAEKSGQQTWRDLIREDIDKAVAAAGSYEHFIQIMQDNGYIVKTNRKYHAIIPPGKEKPIRLYKLGEEYSEQAIVERILSTKTFSTDILPDRQSDIETLLDMPPHAWIEMLRVKHAPTTMRVAVRYMPSPLKTISGLRARYWKYAFLMRRVRSRGTSHVSTKAAFAAREDTQKLNKLDEEYRLLCRTGVSATPELKTYLHQVERTMSILVARRKELHRAKRSAGPEEKERLCIQTESITKQLRALRAEVKICRRVEERAERMGVVLGMAKDIQYNHINDTKHIEKNMGKHR